MKKLTLALSMVLAVLLLAFAASAEAVVYTVDENGAFTVTYDSAVSGAYYAIVAVEGIVEEGTAPSITEDSIQFIDQKTADGTTVSFENILLKVDGTPSTIFLGSNADGFEGPILLGWVNKTEAEGFTVSGTITSDSSKPATITFTPAEGEAIEVTSDETGAYTAEVPAGTYTFVVTKAAHLSYTKNELVVSADATQDATILGGDVDDNGNINISDLNVVLADFGTSTASSDIDGNDTINIGDLNIVLSNFGATATVE